jgi:heme exporter protein CcmD
MSDSYGAYIFLAYAVTAAAIGAVTVRILLEHRRLRLALARLEAQTGAVTESHTS